MRKAHDMLRRSMRSGGSAGKGGFDVSTSSMNRRSPGGSGSGGRGEATDPWDHVSFRERDGAAVQVVRTGNDSHFDKSRPSLPPSVPAVAGLPGRRGPEQELQRCIERSILSGRRFALLHFELERLEQIRQDFGRTGVEKVLARVAGRLTGQLRNTDRVARFEGDAFAVLLADTSTPVEAVHRARQIVAAVGRPIEVEDRYVMVTASVGVALSGADTCTVDELKKAAAAALASARRSGGAQVMCAFSRRAVSGLSMGWTNPTRP